MGDGPPGDTATGGRTCAGCVCGFRPDGPGGVPQEPPERPRRDSRHDPALIPLDTVGSFGSVNLTASVTMVSPTPRGS